MSVTHDQIQELAYRLWQEDGAPEGRDMDYWLRAEAALHATLKPEKKAPPKVKTAAKAKAEKPAAKPKAPAKAKSAPKA